MKPKFWFSTENDYDGPYPTMEAAQEAAVKSSTTKLDTRIEIHQLVAVSEVPKRRWSKTRR